MDALPSQGCDERWIDKVLHSFIATGVTIPPKDQKLVDKLRESLSEVYRKEMEEETERQKEEKLVREILLYGVFSTQHVGSEIVEAEKEESGWMWWSLGKIVGLSIVIQ